MHGIVIDPLEIHAPLAWRCARRGRVWPVQAHHAIAILAALEQAVRAIGVHIGLVPQAGCRVEIIEGVAVGPAKGAPMLLQHAALGVQADGTFRDDKRALRIGFGARWGDIPLAQPKIELALGRAGAASRALAPHGPILRHGAQPGDFLLQGLAAHGGGWLSLRGLLRQAIPRPARQLQSRQCKYWAHQGSLRKAKPLSRRADMRNPIRAPVVAQPEMPVRVEGWPASSASRAKKPAPGLGRGWWRGFVRENTQIQKFMASSAWTPYFWRFRQEFRPIEQAAQSMKQSKFDRFFSIGTSLFGIAAGIAMGYLGLSIALGPKADSSGWILVIAFFTVSGSCIVYFWKQFRKNSKPPAVHPPASPQLLELWAEDLSSLHTRIENFAEIGLSMAPSRTITDLLEHLDRESYARDPYGAILAAYACGICERGWEFDFEALSRAGDYAEAFHPFVRMIGQPDLVTDLSDDFDIRKKSCVVTYKIKGEQRQRTARINNDWVDEKVLSAFLHDLEENAGSDARFCLAETGGEFTVFFLTNAEVAAVNALRPGALSQFDPPEN